MSENEDATGDHNCKNAVQWIMIAWYNVTNMINGIIMIVPQ